ncbi:hypothetical protein A4U64_00595 [Rhodococcus sp. WB1]|nr:hypothetical protein A4U64_00595 [Rhodococcus sp. WB1]
MACGSATGRRITAYREEIVITAWAMSRWRSSPGVFESLRETVYLMRSPANARRTLDAMERRDSGERQPHELLDGDD